MPNTAISKPITAAMSLAAINVCVNSPFKDKVCRCGNQLSGTGYKWWHNRMLYEFCTHNCRQVFLGEISGYSAYER